MHTYQISDGLGFEDNCWWVWLTKADLMCKTQRSLNIKILKGYLLYKMITSQNVSSEAPFKNISFHRKVMFHSQDIQVFVFLTVPWFTKFVIWWVLLHKTGYIFEYILTHNLLSHQTWPIDKFKQGH